MEDIDIYYESLKQVYDQIEKWPKRKRSFREKFIAWVSGIAMILFVLSFIPIIPSLLVFFGGQKGLIIGPIDLRVSSFWKYIIVWILTAIGTGSIFFLIAWIEGKVDSAAERREGPKQTLSPEQLSFVAIYESYKELKIFFVSHLERHVDNSLKALKRIVPPKSLWRVSTTMFQHQIIFEGDYGIPPIERNIMSPELSRYKYSSVIPTPNFANQVLIAQSFLNTFDKYAWFQLDTTTKSILQALISFPAKVYYRLLEKEDLPAVLDILDNLSKFLYAYLPEHNTYMGSEVLIKLQEEGDCALKSFVQQVNDLVSLRPVMENEAKSKSAISSLNVKLSNLYTNNIFFRFTLWFLIILLLTSGIVYLINQRIPNLDVNIMLSLIIGTSVTGAAALAAFTTIGSREKREKKEEEKKN